MISTKNLRQDLLFNVEADPLIEFHFWISMLALWRVVLILIASIQVNFIQENLKIHFFLGLLVSLLICFHTFNYFIFYCFFEFSLIPILMLILGWGYQPERLHAGIRILFYTVICALPLLFRIILWSWSLKSLDYWVCSYNLRENWIKVIWRIPLTLTLGFLVKLPIFGPHLWLPRAHVEAPVFGSIVLAAILLKLGIAGLLLMLPIMCLNTEFFTFLQSFPCAGGALMAILCLRLRDMKTLVAYSSVSHIGFLLTALLITNKFGVQRAVALALSHGFVSSAIFWAVNEMYNRSGSRNLFINKRVLNFIPRFTLIWFVYCLGNMGAPPTLNLVAEIWGFIAIVGNNPILILALMSMAFFASAFTLNLYVSSQHGQQNEVRGAQFPLSKMARLAAINHSVLILLRGGLISFF